MVVEREGNNIFPSKFGPVDPAVYLYLARQLRGSRAIIVAPIA